MTWLLAALVLFALMLLGALVLAFLLCLARRRPNRPTQLVESPQPIFVPESPPKPLPPGIIPPEDFFGGAPPGVRRFDDGIPMNPMTI